MEMNRIASRKVGKLFYKEITLDKITKFHFLRKLHLKKVGKVTLSCQPNILTLDSAGSNYFQSFLMRNIAQKSIDFTEGTRSFNFIKKNKLIFIAKKQSRIKTLKVSLGIYRDQALDMTALYIWLKHTSSLREINFSFNDYRWISQEIKKKNNYFFFWKAIKRHQLETFISDSGFLGTDESYFFLHLNKIPSTVKKIVSKHFFTGLDFTRNTPEISLSLLKNLKSLTLSLAQNAELSKKLLSSIHNPNQLVELSLEFTGRAQKNFTIPQLDLQDGNQLRHLELRFGAEAPKDISKFVSSFKSSKLKVFKVRVNSLDIKQRKNWSWIVDVLSHQLELEKIKIQIGYTASEADQEEKFLKSMIKTISKLKQLKKLKLFFMESGRNVVNSNIISLKELQKLKHLEEICFKSNCMAIDMWNDLIEFSQKTSLQLNKLKIDVGKVTPASNYLREFRNFLNGLKSIEVLSFGKFEVPSSKFWKDLVVSFTEMKNLRKLELGNVNVGQEMDQGILEIVKLPHFQRFKCDHKELSFGSYFDKRALLQQK